MLKETILKMINEQINKEFGSAYLYFDIANFYTEKGLDGFAHWFTVQAREENEHALKFVRYLQDNNEKVALESIPKPDKTYKNFREPLVAASDHERYISASINAIYDAAVSAKDYRTQEFLHWFIKEQLEEEKNAEDLIAKYDLFTGEGRFLQGLDHALSERK